MNDRAPEELQAEIDQLRRRLTNQDEFVAELSRSLARLREYRDGNESMDQALESRAAAAETKVEAMEASWTWRAGRVVMWIPSRAKQLLDSGADNAS